MLQTTIKSEKDFNCQWHKYTETKVRPIVSYFFLIFVIFKIVYTFL